MTGSLETQVGGTHYADLKYQPILVCEEAGAVGGFSIGNMFKYLCRYPHKGKFSEDLQKAKHYSQLYKEVGMLGVNPTDKNAYDPLATKVNEFCSVNAVSPQQRNLLVEAVLALVTQDFTHLVSAIDKLLAEVPPVVDRVLMEQMIRLPEAMLQFINCSPKELIKTVSVHPTPIIVADGTGFDVGEEAHKHGLKTKASGIESLFIVTLM